MGNVYDKMNKRLAAEIPAAVNILPEKGPAEAGEGEPAMLLFVCYPKCTTCQKARKFLESRGTAFTVRDIKEERPNEAELLDWQARSGLPMKKFFNTSGQLYRGMGLSAKVPSMSEAEMAALLATDGMLVKRPILVGDGFVLVGFRQESWEKALEAAGEI